MVLQTDDKILKTKNHINKNVLLKQLKIQYILV